VSQTMFGMMHWRQISGPISGLMQVVWVLANLRLLVQAQDAVKLCSGWPVHLMSRRSHPQNRFDRGVHRIHSIPLSAPDPVSVSLDLPERRRNALTPMTCPNFTSPGNFLPLDLLLHVVRAFSSVAQSRARKGILFALSIVSSREVAVIMCDDPAVREVYR
jgi:hypothetical protein